MPLPGRTQALRSLRASPAHTRRCKQPPKRYHSYMRANKRTTTPDLCGVPCFKGDLVARLRKRLPSEARLKQIRVVFGALADEQRLKILLALKAGSELCVCDVAHVLDVSVSVASHHLRKLRDLGILDDRSDGKMSYYSLRASFVADLVSAALDAA